MEINPINEMTKAGNIELAPLRSPEDQKCLYDQEIACSAPKMKFKMCETCKRCSSKFLVMLLFQRIVKMTAKFFGLRLPAGPAGTGEDSGFSPPRR